MTEGLPDTEFFEMRFRSPLLREITADPVAFLAREPARFSWPVREKQQRCHSEKNRRRAFQQKEPAPACQTEPLDLQKTASDGSDDDETDGNGGHGKRPRLAPITLGERMGPVHDYHRQ